MINTKGRMAAVMAEVEAMKPELRRRREEDQMRGWEKRFWSLLSEDTKRRLRAELQFDRDRDLDERGITSGEAYGEEHPLQSSSTSRRY